MSCPLLQLLQCQSDDLQCIKKWADVPANSEQEPAHDLLAGPHEQRCSGALFLFRRKLQKSQAVLAETSFTSEPTSKVKDEHCGISVMHIMTEGSEHYWRLGNARWRSLTMCTANGPSWSSLYVDFQAFITSPTLRWRYFRVIRWSVCLSASHESQSHSWDLS